MRRTLFTAFALTALALVPGLAAAQGPGTSIRVQALTMGTNFPATGLVTSVTPCSGGPIAASVTTGNDGTGTASVPLGCYHVAVTSVPSGCSLDGKPMVQVVALPGMTPQAAFRVRCA